MSERDPFELLRKINPVSREDLMREESSRLDEGAGSVLARVMTQRAKGRHLRPLRWSLRTLPGRIVVATAAVAAAAVAAWVVTRGGTDQVTAARCFAAASRAAPSIVVRTTPDAAVTACRTALAQHHFRTQLLEHLHACIAPPSSVVVFPSASGNVCRRLHLRPFTRSQRP
jgi:hypothetical protein